MPRCTLRTPAALALLVAAAHASRHPVQRRWASLGVPPQHAYFGMGCFWRGAAAMEEVDGVGA
eukprot:gene1720-463_t